MSWTSEHPNSLNDIPRSFLDQFDDVSWHNDEQPRFQLFGQDGEEYGTIYMWIDYEKIEDREHETNLNRFCIQQGVYMDTVFETADIEELYKYLEDHLDELKVKALIEVWSKETEKLETDGTYADTGEAIKIENYWWTEIDKLANIDAEQLCHKATIDERYKIGINILEMLMLDYAEKKFLADPNDWTFGKYCDALTERFGYDMKDVMKVMYSHNSASMMEYLGEELNDTL